MSTYRPDEIPPEKRRAKPGTAAGKQTLDHTAESLAARDELAAGIPCNAAEAMRRAVQLVSPEVARLAEVLAERWGATPRKALERALAEMERTGSKSLPRASKL